MTNLINSLASRFEKDPKFKPNIKSIVFPAYKNIEFGAELTLDFPLTFLIGKNGTNKSSILQALYGCPDGKSVGEYWFSTHVDSIDEIEGRRPAYFYRYSTTETTEIPEVIKTRIQKDNDPDYWEPSRPIIAYGMAPLPPINRGDPLPAARQTTRWTVMKKDVLYLDFRAEISAFDKAFYKDRRSGTRPAHRNRLRIQSKPLKEVIENRLQSKLHHKKERVKINYEFTLEEVGYVSEILDCRYENITYVEHNFYLSESYSIYVKKSPDTDYSEAFAGSGEASVIRLVYAFSKAKPCSLILLDEPETSLHIAAQYKLRDYILQIIAAACHQVVISTHSPFFTKGMPENSIKILDLNQESNRIKIINKAAPDESSFYLGDKRDNSNRVNIFVEDKLAEAILQHVATTKLTKAQQDKISIIPYVGGANELINLAASEISKEYSNAVFMLDGDIINGDVLDPSQIPEAKDSNLQQIIKDNLGHCPKLPFNSNTTEKEKASKYREFLSYCFNRLKSLPFLLPEKFIVENHSELKNKMETNPKKIIAEYAKIKLGTTGEISSSEILVVQRQLIGEIDSSNLVFTEIKQLLEDTLQFAPTH